MRLRRLMRAIIATLIAANLLSLLSTVSALDTEPPPEDYYPAVYITALQTERRIVIDSGVPTETDYLQVFELHNATADPVNLTGWSVQASDQYGLICTIQLSSWILPDDFVVSHSDDSGLTDSTGNIRTYEYCSQSERQIESIQLVHETSIEETIVPGAQGAFTRKSFTKTYRSGTFSKDFEAMDASSRTTFYAGVWYEPIPTTNIQVVEIMAHARECSPLETAGNCADFVKLYNPTEQSVSLDGMRLRIGYQGQSVTTSNAHPLGGVIAPKSYAVLNHKSDGSVLSITNDGGWVWLEDTFGIELYENTVIEYPSASSVSKVGWSWAYNPSTDQWQWTSTPSPYNNENVFTLPDVNEESADTSALKPCATNQFRNPATNRCKLLASASSSLVPCATNQFRNPATNRCKSIASSTNTLTPCKANQFRNPETNRCKSIASTASDLKPCTENQERNPETNRCRNKSSAPTADFAVQAVKDGGEATVGWWAFGGVGILAAGYAGWEWRTEAATAIKRTASFFTSGK